MQEEPITSPPKAQERTNFSYYVSNEYYVGLAEPLRELGGVGIAVGADQPLDFFTMANLEKVYAVDIDPHTHLITRGYLELGLRFQKEHGHYPTTDEYVALFHPDNRALLLHFLETPSNTYNFSPSDIAWLTEMYELLPFYEYLHQKREFYKNASWIGTDQNLKNVLRSYEEGRITVINDNVVGNSLSDISAEVTNKGESISLVYLSNAPVRSDQTLQRLQQLPLASRAQVVYSTHNSPPGAEVPQGYYCASDWSLMMFSPFAHTRFPEPSFPDVKRIPIGNGTYTLEPLTAGEDAILFIEE